MERKFTEDVYSELSATITDIRTNEFSYILDTLGDVFKYFSKWLGILKIENYLHDVSGYHRKVLDQYDTTQAELDKIFSDVDTVDFTYRDRMVKLREELETQKTMITAVRSTLNPQRIPMPEGFGGGSGTLAAIAEASHIRTTALLDQQLRENERELLWDSFKDAVMGVVDIPLSVFEMTGHFITGRWDLVALDCWDMLGNVVNLGSELGVFAAIVLGRWIGNLTDNPNVRVKAYGEAVKAHETDDLSDYARNLAGQCGEPQEGDPFDYGSFWSKVAVYSDTADTVGSGYKLFTGWTVDGVEPKEGSALADYYKHLKEVIAGHKAISTTGKIAGEAIDAANVNAGDLNAYHHDLDDTFIDQVFDEIDPLKDTKAVFEIIDEGSSTIAGEDTSFFEETSKVVHGYSEPDFTARGLAYDRTTGEWVKEGSDRYNAITKPSPVEDAGDILTYAYGGGVGR